MCFWSIGIGRKPCSIRVKALRSRRARLGSRQTPGIGGRVRRNLARGQGPRPDKAEDPLVESRLQAGEIASFAFT